jgi:hypothetical protein
LGCTVEELLKRLDAQELIEWIAFYSLEPFDGRAEDLRLGVMCTAFYRAMGESKSQPSDFMPTWFDERTELDIARDLMKQFDRIRSGDR